ncbi:MAG: hypothetical protein ACKOPM_04290 [Novosphingobium sp.]
MKNVYKIILRVLNFGLLLLFEYIIFGFFNDRLALALAAGAAGLMWKIIDDGLTGRIRN